MQDRGIGISPRVGTGDLRCPALLWRREPGRDHGLFLEDHSGDLRLDPMGIMQSLFLYR